MNTDNFQWDDEKVLAFIRFSQKKDRDYTGYYSDLDDFKASYQEEQSSSGRDWEITEWDSSGLNGRNWHSEGVTNEAMIKTGFKIKSVKRLSDNSVWTIGDTFLANAGCPLTIKSFEIGDPKIRHNLMKVLSVEYGYWILNELRKPTKEEEQKTTKPPLGIIPEWLWKEQRQKELFTVITRYLDLGKMPQLEWIKEFGAISEWLEKYNEDKQQKGE